jgi:hypothetical protein
MSFDVVAELDIPASPRLLVDAACAHVLAPWESGVVDGVHLVALSRYAGVAQRLSGLL